MRVFVAGATGALGSRLVPLLVAGGHSVVGSTHTAANLAAICQAGAEAVLLDGLNAQAVIGAVTAAKPDVIVHEMTGFGSNSDLRHFDRTFALTNRLRTAGVDNLLAAAAVSNAQRFIAQSFCGWPYARSGDAVKAEDAPLDPTPPRECRRTLEAIRYPETRVLLDPTIAGLVLRYGAFYGPGTGMLDEKIVEQLRHRRFPMLGAGTGWWSLVHIDDAAAATAIAVERGERGIYNIVDDDPARVADWLPALAAAAGGEPPHRIPKWLARPLAGSHLVTMMTDVRAGSNAKAKRTLGWQPRHASWRTGFQAAMAYPPSSSG